MDGVLLDTEQVWNDVRGEFARAQGGHWSEVDQTAVMGANSMQWARYMRECADVPLSDDEIYSGVVGELRRLYESHLPLIPGAASAVADVRKDFRLGLASSSPRELIEYALELSDLRDCFEGVVSSDEVGHGKPEPDVYLAACALMQIEPSCAAAVEDSSNGIRSAASAGLAVIAIPNPVFRPAPDALALAQIVLGSVRELDAKAVWALKPAHCS